jgi:hypothetical protein
MSAGVAVAAVMTVLDTYMPLLPEVVSVIVTAVLDSST